MTQNINWISVLNGNCHDTFGRFDFTISDTWCHMTKGWHTNTANFSVNMIILRLRHFVTAKREIGFPLVFFWITFKIDFREIYIFALHNAKRCAKMSNAITVANKSNICGWDRVGFFFGRLCHWLLLKIKSHTYFSSKKYTGPVRHHYYYLFVCILCFFLLSFLSLSTLLWLLTLDLVYPMSELRIQWLKGYMRHKSYPMKKAFKLYLNWCSFGKMMPKYNTCTIHIRFVFIVWPMWCSAHLLSCRLSSIFFFFL